MAVVYSPNHHSHLDTALNHLFHSRRLSVASLATPSTVEESFQPTPTQRWPWELWKRHRNNQSDGSAVIRTSPIPRIGGTPPLLETDIRTVEPAIKKIPPVSTHSRSTSTPIMSMASNSPPSRQPPRAVTSGRMGALFTTGSPEEPSSPTENATPTQSRVFDSYPKRKPIFSLNGDSADEKSKDSSEIVDESSPESDASVEAAKEEARDFESGQDSALPVVQLTQTIVDSSPSAGLMSIRQARRKVSFTYGGSPTESCVSVSTTADSSVAESADFPKLVVSIRRNSSGLSLLSQKLTEAPNSDNIFQSPTLLQAAILRRRRVNRGWSTPDLPIFEGKINLATFESIMEPAMAAQPIEQEATAGNRGRSQSEADLRRHAVTRLNRAHGSHQQLHALERIVDDEVETPRTVSRTVQRSVTAGAVLNRTYAKRRNGFGNNLVMTMEPLPPATAVSPSDSDVSPVQAADETRPRSDSTTSATSSGTTRKLSAASLHSNMSLTTNRTSSSLTTSTCTTLLSGMSSPSLSAAENTLVDPTWRVRSLRSRMRNHSFSGNGGKPAAEIPEVAYGDDHTVW
ncbi:hypothetical protein HDU93_008848 [Gonapodya sp. JEL0774]|nr:hypothetical protein HDU93_008848 [Gonapodya sp. JEL0774]